MKHLLAFILALLMPFAVMALICSIWFGAVVVTIKFIP